MGKRASSSEKLAEWTARLERWKASGLSVARFSEREGVSAVSVYLWRKKLARAPRFTAMVAAPIRSPFQRVELVTSPLPSQPAVIRLPQGVSIELGSDAQFASQMVESLVRQLCVPRTTMEARECSASPAT